MKPAVSTRAPVSLASRIFTFQRALHVLGYQLHLSELACADFPVIAAFPHGLIGHPHVPPRKSQRWGIIKNTIRAMIWRQRLHLCFQSCLKSQLSHTSASHLMRFLIKFIGGNFRLGQTFLCLKPEFVGFVQLPTIRHGALSQPSWVGSDQIEANHQPVGDGTCIGMAKKPYFGLAGPGTEKINGISKI